MWNSIFHSSGRNITQKLPITCKNYSYYGSDSENPVALTNKISQVNKGQITTYPYNVNTAEFGGTTGSKEKNLFSNDDEYKITIYPTHEQIYQANTNGDEVSVWYCLAGSNAQTGDTSDNRYKYYKDYDIVPNDVANNYYIFSVRNVIYTGAGHCNIFTIEEAKLFLNTLVAGYRAGNEQPEVNYRDRTGLNDTNYLILTVNEEEEGSEEGINVEGDVTGIKVSDPNENDALIVKFYSDAFCTDELNEIAVLYSSYKAEDGIYVGAGDELTKTDGSFKVHNETLYYFNIPQSKLDELAANNEAVIYAKATTGVGDASVSSNVVPLYLRSANEYNLS